MRHPNFNVVELIQSAIGSSDSIDSLVEDRYPDMDWMCDMTEDELKYFDSRIFNCQQCGYWCDQRDRDQGNEIEWTCNDCK